MDVVKFLRENVSPSTGCTELTTVGYAASIAYNSLLKRFPPSFRGAYQKPDESSLVKITIDADRNVYKNACSVTIPETSGEKGMEMASAMGIYCNPLKELNLFEGITPEDVAKAKKILNAGKVVTDRVSDNAELSRLDVKVHLEYLIHNIKNDALVRIEQAHNNVSSITLNGNIVYEKNLQLEKQEEERVPYDLEGMIGIARGLTQEEREIVYKGILMNLRLSDEGLKNKYGLAVGKQLETLVKQGIIGDDLLAKVMIRTAAAGDARMGGINLPAMTTSGSGNQGIIALIPIAVTAEMRGIDKDRVCEAAMLSHLVTKYISNYAGKLSALCGCAIKAGMGATAGVTYLLGGEREQINNAINIAAANITGIICDGAKSGCALKLSTGAVTAVKSALMALNGMKVSSDNGIVHERAEETMESIGKISDSMVNTDLKIVEIMQTKKPRL